jgi:transposase-like protein
VLIALTERCGTRRTISLKPKVTRRQQPSMVAVDEKQIEVDGEEKWLYAAIDTE